MIDVSYLLAAKNLLDRRERQLDLTRKDKEKDREEFFYWILRLLDHMLEYSFVYCREEVRANILEKDSGVYPSKMYFEEEEVGQFDGYQSYSDRDEFIPVLHEVVALFNQIGELTDGGYSAKIFENDGRIIVDVRLYPKEKTEA